MEKINGVTTQEKSEHIQKDISDYCVSYRQKGNLMKLLDPTMFLRINDLRDIFAIGTFH